MLVLIVSSCICNLNAFVNCLIKNVHPKFIFWHQREKLILHLDGTYFSTRQRIDILYNYSEQHYSDQLYTMTSCNTQFYKTKSTAIQRMNMFSSPKHSIQRVCLGYTKHCYLRHHSLSIFFFVETNYQLQIFDD